MLLCAIIVFSSLLDLKMFPLFTTLAYEIILNYSMFNFFKKPKDTFKKHQFKQLSMDLPGHWQFEMEQDEQQACYDPKSQSTLRINILTVRKLDVDPSNVDLNALTGDLPYKMNSNGLLLVNPTYLDTTEGGQRIVLVTWRLINAKALEKIIAVFTYTVLRAELDTAHEQGVISMVSSSLMHAEVREIRHGQ